MKIFSGTNYNNKASKKNEEKKKKTELDDEW